MTTMNEIKNRSDDDKGENELGDDDEEELILGDGDWSKFTLIGGEAVVVVVLVRGRRRNTGRALEVIRGGVRGEEAGG